MAPPIIVSGRRLFFSAFASVAALVVANVLTGCSTRPPPSPPLAPPYTGPILPIEQSDRGVQIFLPSSMLFAVGESTFDATNAAPYLDRIAFLLTTKTDKKVAIEGNTDNSGTDAGNVILALARAKAVEKALTDRKVPVERLSAFGFAANRPIASNATEEGRKLNRRVELIILDEKVANITKGEPANAFASAWDQLKKLVESGAVRPVGQ